jgi:ATP-dependent helicase/nuclease subunit A
MQPSLRDSMAPPADGGLPDREARLSASDPAHDVVLEASAGTGKTRVLVDRYVRLIESGVEPRNILAMTFTRKAAAEMRDRVLAELTRRAAGGAFTPDRWRALTEHAGEIQISTIDAFCFSLLREFPLEAGVDPGFEPADETEIARFAREAVDGALAAARGLAGGDEAVRLLLARVKPPTLLAAIASLVDRRHVALPAVASFVGRQPAFDATDIGTRFLASVRGVLGPDERGAMLEDGPVHAAWFRWVARDLVALDAIAADAPGAVQQLRRHLERYFLTKDGAPRQRIPRQIRSSDFRSSAARRRHEQRLTALAPGIADAIRRLDADVNVLLARGLLRVLAIASERYAALLADAGLMDFAGMLDRSVRLLERQEEFARSRLKLQARYHHVLVDEFQDTSRLQWRLVELLIAAWGEGESVADAPTSIFVVGDRKQSIYRFRHAEVTLLQEAARRIAALRPGRAVRASIRHSFRAVPELLSFVNALSAAIEGDPDLEERFTYLETDTFPVPDVAPGARRDGAPVLGIAASGSMAESAAAVADEVDRLLREATVRDRTSGTRAARPDDIAILFRARAGHQYFEDALEARSIKTYVYKGLGFFDAPEVQDVQAVLRYLADPGSDLRAAELLRSRLVRVSDPGLISLGPSFAGVLSARDPAPHCRGLSDLDRAALLRLHEDAARWRRAADRVPPSQLIDQVLRESAYAAELGGRRLEQARENVKKIRALLRRVENRGYATLARIAGYFDTLRTGDESHAVVDAAGAVNLMTMHAAKGLEFPIVFLVNLHMAGRGRPAGFSVIERGPGGEPEVAFNSTEGTRLEERREMEELRRLLYVGVTRARDRLYLAAEVAEGVLKRGPHSLASLLPDSLAAMFTRAHASAAGEDVEWGAGGRSFAFRTCKAGARLTEPVGLAHEPHAVVAPPALLVKDRRLPAAAHAAGRAFDPSSRVAAGGTAGSGTAVVGALVHRMFQQELDPGLEDDGLAERALELLRPDERVDVPDEVVVAAEAARVYRAFRARPDVVDLLGRGPCLYEVPFSYVPAEHPGMIVRGVVDCLLLPAGAPPVVIEFKTGVPRADHDAQVALYGEAIARALGVPRVSTCVLYA